MPTAPFNLAPAELAADARRFLDRVREQSEVVEGERGYETTISLPHRIESDLDALLRAAAGANGGWGVWVVNENRWCNAADGDGNGLVVFRTKEEADANALHQSVMYDLGPCEARPFDLVMEVQ